jgi:lipid II:glycine glycyltransferase (peptidoglycan interpeptide bridge formation enzyme)
MEQFYRLYSDMCRRKSLPGRSLGYFKALYETLACRGNIQVFIARRDSQFLNAALLLTLANKAWYVYGASTPTKWYAGEGLIWGMIEWCLQNEFTFFDFHGMPDHPPKGHPERGVFEFKQDFQGELVRWFPEHDRVFRELTYRAASLGGQRLFRMMPRWLLKGY